MSGLVLLIALLFVIGGGKRFAERRTRLKHYLKAQARPTSQKHRLDEGV